MTLIINKPLLRDFFIKTKPITYYFLFKGLFISMSKEVLEKSFDQNLSIMADAIFDSNGKAIKVRGEHLRPVIQQALNNDFKNLTLINFSDYKEALSTAKAHVSSYSAINLFNSVQFDLIQERTYF